MHRNALRLGTELKKTVEYCCINLERNVPATALVALDIVRQEPHRRTQLLANAARLRARLREQGWNTGDSESQIIPIVVGDPERTMHFAVRLREHGFFVPGIRPPSVPEGESLLRLSLCYHHTDEMIDALVEELGRLRD